MPDELTGQIEGIILKPIQEISAELVEFQIRHRGKTAVVEIIADRPGGITIGECAYINKKIDQSIEKKQWFGGDYVVEVSSPGLDRPLKTPKDFMRAMGKVVRFHLLQPVENKIEHAGEVSAVEGNKNLIKKNENIIVIPLEIISKAVRVIE